MGGQLLALDRQQELNTNGFTREGHSFAGWNTESDGSGVAYADGQSVEFLSAEAGGEVILYAQWAQTSAISYTVRFDANGGTGSMDGQQFTYGVAQNLSANGFTREG